MTTIELVITISIISIISSICFMKYENNSINIGDRNKIKKSNFHSKNKIVNSTNTGETVGSKIKWQIVVPIVVGVIIAAIVFYLGIN